MYSLPTDGFLEPHWRFKFALIPVDISHNSHEIVHTTQNNFYYASLRPKTPLNYIFCIILGAFPTQGKITYADFTSSYNPTHYRPHYLVSLGNRSAPKSCSIQDASLTFLNSLRREAVVEEEEAGVWGTMEDYH